MEIRTGIGYDSHRLVEGRALVLGGVEIPFSKGLLGHSDGDVLLHAVMDALLGASGRGDIGTHFPDKDPKYKDISSLELLKQVKEMLKEDGWRVGNIDATLLIEEPKISPFVFQMRQKVAHALAISPDNISIKATTNEGMGFIGRGEGMAAIAAASIYR